MTLPIQHDEHTLFPDALTVLISRPLEQSIEFKDRLSGNVRCVISPILEIQDTGQKIDPTPYSSLVFTSRNGVRAASRLTNLEGLKAFTIGKKTADLALNFGMKVTASNGGSEALVSLIRSRHVDGKLLHLRGEHTTGNVAQQLCESGILTDELTTYRQGQLSLSKTAISLIRGEKSVLVPLFSPRSSALMGQEFTKYGVTSRFGVIGMSANVVEAWEGPEPSDIAVAASPDLDAMVEITLNQVRKWA